MNELSTVTYHFADGTKQVSGINNQVLVNEKGRARSQEQINEVFKDTMHDLGAISFEL
jgi:hypothetical protein